PFKFFRAKILSGNLRACREGLESKYRKEKRKNCFHFLNPLKFSFNYSLNNQKVFELPFESTHYFSDIFPSFLHSDHKYPEVASSHIRLSIVCQYSNEDPRTSA